MSDKAHIDSSGLEGTRPNRPRDEHGAAHIGTNSGQPLSSAARSPEELEEVRMRKTTGVAERLFNAPSPSVLVLPVIVLSVIVGFFALFDMNHFSDNFTWEPFFKSGIIFGFGMIGIPALIAGALITPTAKAFGGLFYARRAILLAFVSQIVIFFIFIIAKILSNFIHIDFIIILAMTYAWILSFQLAVFLAISHHSSFRSLPPAFIQPGLGIIFIYFGSTMVYSDYNMDLTKTLIIVLFLLIFLAASALWLWIVSRPFQRAFNFNVLKLTRQGFSHFTEGEGAGTELEGFFESFGRTMDATAGVLAIRRREDSPEVSTGGTGKPVKYKALMVVPDIHKGPFGYLGGSNMPKKLGEELEANTEHILVPHGTATHDRNPVSSVETRRISRALKTAVEELPQDQFSHACSKLIRKSGQHDVNVSMQYFGDVPVSTFTAAPKPTDDLNYKIGPQARSAILEGSKDSKGIEPMFIDAHNSMVPGEGYVHYGSPKAKSILKTLKEASKLSSGEKVDYGLKIGIAEKLGYTVNADGLGPKGIQVLAVQSPPDETAVYILFDGNNLVPGLRGEIIKHIKFKNRVNEVEVLTSDNHVVNMTIGGYAPVGEKLDRRILFKDLEKLVRAACADLEPVETASARVELNNFKVFGTGNSLKLSTTINDSVALMGKTFAACYGIAFGLALGLMGLML